MQLVGLYKLNPPAGDYSLHEAAFKRLSKEVKHTGNITRIIGFDSYTVKGITYPFSV